MTWKFWRRGKPQTPTAQPWWPVTDPLDVKHLGKAVEETGELVSIMGRILTQGVDGVDPKSGKCNRVAMEDEIADVIAKVESLCERFSLDVDRINRRKLEKREFHRVWFTWDRPDMGGKDST